MSLLVVLMAGIAVFIVARTHFRAQLDEALVERVHTLAALVVEVIGRTDRVRRAESAVLAAVAVGVLFAVIGSTAAVRFGVRGGLSPVRELGRAVDDIDARELILPGPRRAHPEELRPIVSALEGRLDRLRAALERERRFTDAAARGTTAHHTQPVEPIKLLPAARSDHTHRGLGLTIVQSLAAAMRLHRHVAITPERRLRVRLVSAAQSDGLAARSEHAGGARNASTAR